MTTDMMERLRKAVARSWEQREGDFTICAHCYGGGYGMWLSPELHRPDCIVLTIPEALPDGEYRDRAVTALEAKA